MSTMVLSSAVQYWTATSEFADVESHGPFKAQNFHLSCYAMMQALHSIPCSFTPVRPSCYTPDLLSPIGFSQSPIILDLHHQGSGQASSHPSIYPAQQLHLSHNKICHTIRKTLSFKVLCKSTDLHPGFRVYLL